MIVHDVIQYSPEWWTLRMGVPTASAFDRIITPTGKPSAQMEGYIDQLLSEIMCPQANFFTERQGHTAAMRNGINTEPEARKYFELHNNVSVRQVGFITTDDGKMGCSPDFMTADMEPGELKCPEPKQQVSYLRKNILPVEFKPQTHGHLIVTGKPRCHFMSYCAGLPPLMVVVVQNEFTDLLRAALEEFHERFTSAKTALGIWPTPGEIIELTKEKP